VSRPWLSNETYSCRDGDSGQEARIDPAVVRFDAPSAEGEADALCSHAGPIEYAGGVSVGARFDLPIVNDPVRVRELTAQAGFIEGRYRFHPRMQIGVRADRLAFGRLTDATTGVSATWDANVTRLEVAFGLRLSRTLEVRAGWQENRRDSERGKRRGLPIAGLLYWF